jgi:putative acetyltransferase
MRAAMGELVVRPDDPQSPDVRALLAKHLAFNRRHSPPEDVHALDVPELLGDDVSFFSIRHDGELIAIGALKQLDSAHAELKSMHTVERARRRGAGRAMLDYLVGVAQARGCHRVSLETGSMAAFAPARALYASARFESCEPFADYKPSPYSAWMTLALDEGHRSESGSTGSTEIASS